MDPISGILAYFASEKVLEAVSSGILGNRADSLVSLAFGPMWKYLQDSRSEGVGANHDLERAGVAAYLDATGLLADEAIARNKNFWGQPPQELSALREGVSNSRRNLHKLPFIPIPDTQLFLLEESIPAGARRARMRETLENRLREDCRAWGVGYTMPAPVEELLRDGWTQEMKNGLIVERRWHDVIAIAFVEQLKQHQALAHVFQSKLLAEIASREPAAPATFEQFTLQWDRLEAQLGRIEATVTQIDDRTARIEDMVAKLLAQQQAPPIDSLSQAARLRDLEAENARLREQLIALVANASPPVEKQLARFSEGDATAWHEVKRLKLEEVEARDKSSAEDLRQLASLAMIAKDRGEATLSEVIELWERAQAAAPDYHWGWVVLKQLCVEAGNLPRARQAAEKALASTEEHRWNALLQLGDVLELCGEQDEAGRYYDEATKICLERFQGLESIPVRYFYDLSQCLSRVGGIQIALGNLDGAKDNMDRTVRLLDALIREFGNNDNLDFLHTELVSQINRLTRVRFARGEFSEALPDALRSQEIATSLAEKYPHSRALQSSIWSSKMYLADTYVRIEELEAAKPLYASALEIATNLAQQAPESAEAQCDLIVSYLKFGNAHQDPEAIARALSLAEDLHAQGRLAPRDHHWLPLLRETLARHQESS